MTVTEAIQRGLILFFFVFMVLAFLWGIIVVFSKGVGLLEKGKKRSQIQPSIEEEAYSSVENVKSPPHGPWGGRLVLENVDEQTAAIAMAIVSDESGIPLSELVFKRISLKDNPLEKEK